MSHLKTWFEQLAIFCNMPFSRFKVCQILSNRSFFVSPHHSFVSLVDYIIKRSQWIWFTSLVKVFAKTNSILRLKILQKICSEALNVIHRKWFSREKAGNGNAAATQQGPKTMMCGASNGLALLTLGNKLAFKHRK